MSRKMTSKVKSNGKKETVVKKSNVVLLNTNTMLPVVKPLSIEKSCIPKQRVPRNRYRIVDMQKYRSKRALSSLEPPRFLLPQKVHKNAEQKATGVNISASMPTQGSDIVQNYFRMKRLLRKRKKDELPFPNSPFISHVSSNVKKESQKVETNSITDVSIITDNSKKLRRKKNQETIKDISDTMIQTGECAKDIDANLYLYPNRALFQRNSTRNLTASEIMLAFLKSDMSVKRTISDSSLLLRSLEKLLTTHSYAAIDESINYINTRSRYSSLYPSEMNLSSDTLRIYSKCSPFATESESNDTNTKNVIDTIKPLIKKQSKSDSKIRSRRRFKYSWEDIENWIPPCQRREKLIENYKDKYYRKSPSKENVHCKIKYSWQVIGIGTQTSQELLHSFLKENDEFVPLEYQCKVKYSWQIVGTGTQASLEDNNDMDYWHGSVLVPNKNYNDTIKAIGRERIINGKKYIFLNSQNVQTCTEKENQTDYTDCRVTYSWHNDIRKHLYM